MWVPGLETVSFAKAVSAPNLGAISPVPWALLIPVGRPTHCGRCHLGLMLLGYIREEAEQATKSKYVSSVLRKLQIPAKSLFAFCSDGLSQKQKQG